MVEYSKLSDIMNGVEVAQLLQQPWCSIRSTSFAKIKNPFENHNRKYSRCSIIGGFILRIGDKQYNVSQTDYKY
jgi:hypothetical protein